MATRRTTFAKTQRERDKREKAAAKRERRAALAAESEGAEPVEPEDHDAIVAQLAALHVRYEEGGIALDEFAARQEELRARLSI